jgi:hypothetical protein
MLTDNKKSLQRKVKAFRMLVGVFCPVLFLYGMLACIGDDYSACPLSYGWLTVSTQWMPRSAEADIPRSYTFYTDEHSESGLSPSSEPNRLAHEFPGGLYHVRVYNPADEIQVTGEKVRVNTQNGWVAPLPGWFFSYSANFIVISDSVCEVKARMKQQTRLFILELTTVGEAIERIKSLDATLNGAASELNIDDGSVGEPAGIAFHLVSFSGNIWLANSRLLGMTEETHKLTLAAGIQMADGASLELMNYEADVTPLLADFNRDKHYPMVLKARIYLEPDPNDPIRMRIVIKEWNVVYGDSIIAE